MNGRAAIILCILMVLASLNPASSGGPQSPEHMVQPIEGTVIIDNDWVVTDYARFRNATVYLSGNLTVEGTGHLEFVNTTLVMNLSANGQYNIVVDGRFTMNDLDMNPATQDDASSIVSNKTLYKYTLTARAGSDIYFRNSIIMYCGYSGLYPGLSVLTAYAVFEGMTFQNNYYGITLRNSGAVVRDSVFQGNAYGLFVSFCHPTLEGITVKDSTARGIFFYYSASTLADSILQNNRVGIYFQNSQANVVSCEIIDSQSTGVYTMNSSPLLTDCVLTNTVNIQATMNSFPRLLNTTMDESSVIIDRGLYVSMGQRITVSVADETGAPLADARVSVLDAQGNPASSGITDFYGNAPTLVFRERFLTRNGPIEMPEHRVMAFRPGGETVHYGDNVTALFKDGHCLVTVITNPSGVEVWPTAYTISDARSYTGTTIIALGDVTINNGGGLELSNSSLMMYSPSTRTLSCTLGSISLRNTTLSAMATSDLLTPARMLIKVAKDNPVFIEDSVFRWITEFELRSGLADIYNMTIDHGSLTGLKVISCAPRIDRLSVDWTPIGLHLSGDSSKLSNINVKRARTYGVYATQSTANIVGLSANDSARGFYAYNVIMALTDVETGFCDYGVYVAFAPSVDIRYSSIRDSAMAGVLAVDSSLRLFEGEITGSGTALDVRTSSVWAESFNLAGNSMGLRVRDCAPLLLNSSLSNTIDVSVERGSSAALVNCTLDTGKTSVRPSGHIDLGHWFHARVLGSGSQPVSGCNVSVMDRDGRVSGSGMTDNAGMLHNLAFRQARLFWNHTLDYDNHTLVAFRQSGGSLQGMATTQISPGEVIDVHVSPGGMGWTEWTAANTVIASAGYSDTTIIAHAGVSVENGASLNLENTTLWFFGDPNINTALTVWSGSFNMHGGTLTTLRAKAPLQPSGAWLTYRAKSSGELADVLMLGMNQVTTYTDDLVVERCRIMESSMTGLYVQASSPRVNGTLFYRCTDGLYTVSGSPDVTGTSFVECKNNGFYANGGRPVIHDAYFAKNINGFRLESVAKGTVSDCLAEFNDYGFYLLASSPDMARAEAMNNAVSGFHLQDSHPTMVSVTSTGSVYGCYLQKSWPVILNSSFGRNTNGIYAYQSGPYISGCDLTGNDIGFNSLGDATAVVTGTFSSGKTEEYATFVGGGTRDHISVTLPSRAVVREANISIRGSEIGGHTVRGNEFTQSSPEIHKNWVVWQEYRDSAWNIYAYDLSADTNGNGVPNYLETPPLENDPALFKITDSPHTQTNPDIYGDTIVWTDYRAGNPSIYAYTFSNNTEWPVCAQPDSQIGPSIDRDRVVWQDLRNGNYDIYMLNISTGEESRLTDSPNHDMGVNIHGDHVVWYSYYGSPPDNDYSDIILFDINAWQHKNINNDAPLQFSPDVHDNTVVWHDNRNGNWEIYMYDIADSAITRLTYDPDNQQNFMPRIHGDKVVYYFHNRLTSLWSVRMFNISTGIQTILEPDVKGDSHPVVYGQRVAWVNRTGNNICVLDFALSGYPEDVVLDINKDGAREFFHPGELKGSDYISGTWLAQVFNKGLDRVDGGNTEISMSITANGTGKVILGPVSVTYDIPTYIVDTAIGDSKSTGVRCSGSSPVLVNSSLWANPLDFSLNSGSGPRTLNTTFSDSKLQFQDRISNLTVQNFLHVRAQNLSGHPLDAFVSVSDNGLPVHEMRTGHDGEVQWLVLTDRTHNLTGRHENATLAEVTMGENIFADNPRSVDMSASHWEIFTTDSVGPSARSMYPPPGWTIPDIRPEISVIVTDNQAVDLSSVRLYVQTFSVFYEHSEVPGGYNISYQHPADFPDGATVTCRIYARDFDGNVLDYTWEFRIDTRAVSVSIELRAGWNLVSIPLETADTYIRNVLSSIDGKWSVAKWYDGLEKRWKTHRVGSSASTFSEVDRTMGIWLHVTEACTLTVSGITPEQTSITLHAGWNLVGYPTLSGEMVGLALWGTGADRVEVFHEETPYIREAEPSYVLKPGEGFWVRVPADTVWVVDW